MRRRKRELGAILAGVITAYVFQLVMITLILLQNNELRIDLTVFVPQRIIQLAIAPVASWMYMGIVGVSWQKKWNKITKRIGAVIVPFVIISLLMLFVIPTALEFWQFWIADILLSSVASLTICRNLLINSSEEDRRK